MLLFESSKIKINEQKKIKKVKKARPKKKPRNVLHQTT